MKAVPGTLAVGSRVGAYELREVIGVGGMGVVFDAERAGERVALKVLQPQRASDARAVRRFHDEALAGLIVRHENLTVTVDHGDTDEGVPFLVMERIVGEALGSRIQRDGAPSLRHGVAVAQQILAGLGALHSAGIVHGDVKSDNVLVERLADGSDRVRLIDFGLAHVQFSPGDEVRRLTVDEEMVSGTPEYMAPEVIRGEGSSMASDLYSVGIILYELITGSTPFAGGAPTEIVRRHLEDEVVPPSLRCDDEVPAALERIVLKALSKQAEDRFDSAAAFASALVTIVPLLQDSPGTRVTQRLSRETPTLDWHREVRKRFGRGTPRYARPMNTKIR